MKAHTNLGRAEILLRALGIATWGYVAWPRLAALYASPGYASPGSIAHVHWPAWVGAWLAYGLAFCGTTFRRAPGPLLIALLGIQTASVLALPFLGFSGFEGLLLAVVAAEAAAVLAPTLAIAWAAGQVIPLFFVAYRFNPARHIANILGAYSTFAVFAVAVIHLRDREVRARRELARVNGELVATQGLLEDSTRAGERLRISRELHDTLGHHLAALRIQLDLASRIVADGKGADAVRQSYELARNMLTEVRTVVSAMRDEGSVDLESALGTMCAAVPEPRVTCVVGQGVRVADPARAHALFRCAQEALTNAVKHANAGAVRIAVDHADGGVELRVRDDGRGAAALTLGGGLTGMRERAETLGGRFSTHSPDGGGFEVRVWLPAGPSPG